MNYPSKLIDDILMKQGNHRHFHFKIKSTLAIKSYIE